MARVRRERVVLTTLASLPDRFPPRISREGSHEDDSGDDDMSDDDDSDGTSDDDESDGTSDNDSDESSDDD